jgi:hypothetical protein
VDSAVINEHIVHLKESLLALFVFLELNERVLQGGAGSSIAYHLALHNVAET